MVDPRRRLAGHGRRVGRRQGAVVVGPLQRRRLRNLDTNRGAAGAGSRSAAARTACACGRSPAATRSATPASCADVARTPFLLDAGIVFLNHGSFGACPRPVFDAYQALAARARAAAGRVPGPAARRAARRGARALGGVPRRRPGRPGVRAERDHGREHRRALAASCAPGDEVLATDHEYGACDAPGGSSASGAACAMSTSRCRCRRRATRRWSSSVGRRDRARRGCSSSATSPRRPLIRFPVAEICRRARAAGILSVIDGAHAPGQLDLDLEALGADFYAGNCHKWLCAPKGGGFLCARPERRDAAAPAASSAGARARSGSPSGTAGRGRPTPLHTSRSRRRSPSTASTWRRRGLRATRSRRSSRRSWVRPSPHPVSSIRWQASSFRPETQHGYAGVCGRSTGSRSWRKSGTAGR